MLRPDGLPVIASAVVGFEEEEAIELALTGRQLNSPQGRVRLNPALARMWNGPRPGAIFHSGRKLGCCCISSARMNRAFPWCMMPVVIDAIACEANAS